ncbi:putative NAD(P)-binding domain-containing protein [Rosa chinensis]|uniref:Putative NAD(P)-binding domain-containing protein n=1 Tax=Rosa chinensis TaxID=74649 RepID=A0A2P6PLQ6_ROSCH|nr:putative NAD(P)-binding domain-containing protein [Rosa chinensis]
MEHQWGRFSIQLTYFLISKLQAEHYIRKSGINYTIIRPGELRNEPLTGNLVMEPEVSQDTIWRHPSPEIWWWN